MASRVLQRLATAVGLIGAVSIATATSAEATRPVRRTNRPTAARGFNLFAGAVNVVMNVNRVQCNINNIGESCVDPTNSPVLGGGFWPKGSPNQYIFNSGLQVAAIIPGTKAQFAWGGDTVGAFFFDPRGDQAHGEGRTNVFNALNADDLANWPTAANINDTSLFNLALIGRHTVSQQDTWVRMWDGNTSLSTGRQHPMGILVEQRGLAWNFPTGNQDIVYFLYRFINITTTDATKYAGLADFGYSPSDINDIVAIAQEFKDRSQAAYNIVIPDSGFTWTNMFASFAQDPDVGQAGSNYSNANLVFSMAMAYKSDFKEPTWQFPPDINGAPFAAAPGFEAVKYLKSPQNIGIAMSGNTTNGAPFPDAVGVQRLWRNLSGNLLPTDGTCSVPNPQARRMCYWAQAAADTRFFEASGPFSMAPGQSATIVVAYVHAAPLGSAAAVTPPSGSGLPISAFNLNAFVGGNMVPGLALNGARIPSGQDTIRSVDRAMGWLNQNDLDGDGVIEQCSSPPPAACVTEVTTAPRSALNKGLVAQAVFDNKFLLPFAPEAPNFFLVPGDNAVTVTWQPSSTETVGDPFFVIASNVASPLYDPNFRQFDVEGYRIYRGRTQSEMEVVASFDYAGTQMVDRTGQFWNATDYSNQCAPELGVYATCPATFGGPATVPPKPATWSIPLVGEVMQIPPGGRVALAGTPTVIFNTIVDTAVTGGGSHLPALQDAGVPFAFTDNGVRNGFRYFYAVTAFDINSVKSGPSSLESPLITKTTTPRAGSGQEVAGNLGTLQLFGRGATALDPNAPEPTFDPATAKFSGPMPATNGLSVGFAAFLPNLVADGSLTVTIDSVIPGEWFNGTRPTKYWFTGQGAGAPAKFSVNITGVQTAQTADVVASSSFQATTLSQAQASRFGGDSTYALYGSATVSVNGSYRYTNQYRGLVNGNPAAGVATGPRWWAGAANETTNDPNGINCLNTPAGFSCTLADLSRNAGQIAGVGIFDIASYGTIATTEPIRTTEGVTSSIFRAADFKWYWGANGAVDSVVDVTHDVRVPFNRKIRASWGILNDSSFTNVVSKAALSDTSITRLTWTDAACIAPAIAYTGACGGLANFPAADSGAFFMNHARLAPVTFASSSYAGGAGLSAAASTGTGFIIFLNGHLFLMQMAAFPAAGTVWNLRTFAGNITGSAPNYHFVGATRPPAVPGLRAQIAYTGSTFDPSTTTEASLATVHTVPDPYYVTNSLEQTANSKVLRFVNLPSQCIVRIYSASGVLVNVLSLNDAGAGGELVWNLRNRNNQFVASGVYFYHVEAADGKTKVGRFTVVNFAQ